MPKILLSGLGRWGANHLRVLRSLPVELFIADVSPQQIEKAVASGFPQDHATTDPRKFYDQIDGAVLVTPAEAHFDACRELLELGKDVFVEKPITLHASDARTLVELAERKKRMLQVGYIFRFDPASTWLQQAIANGDFGHVRMIRGRFCGFKRPRNDSGVTFADGIHFVDLFNYFLGRPPVAVTAHLTDYFGRGMEDESLLALDYTTAAGPTWATVETGYHLPGKFREVVIVGDKLSAVCDFNIAQYKIKTFANTHTINGADVKAVEGISQQLEFPPEEPLHAELRRFLEAIETRKPHHADGWAGYESVRILEAALQSAKEARTIKLN